MASRSRAHRLQWLESAAGQLRIPHLFQLQTLWTAARPTAAAATPDVSLHFKWTGWNIMHQSFSDSKIKCPAACDSQWTWPLFDCCDWEGWGGGGWGVGADSWGDGGREFWMFSFCRLEQWLPTFFGSKEWSAGTSRYCWPVVPRHHWRITFSN